MLAAVNLSSGFCGLEADAADGYFSFILHLN